MAFEPIEELNDILRRMCKGENVKLLEAYAHMEDPRVKGTLDPRWDDGDGAHLNGAGYQRLGEFIAAGVKDLLTVPEPAGGNATVRVLCLGDSLTEGYPGHLNSRETGNWWEPYTKALDGKGRDIINLGISGDTTMGMRSRFNTWIDIERDCGRPVPKICIVMGGTNDLFIGFVPDMVADNLRSIYGLCKKFRIVPVGVTVLPVTI